MWLVIAASKCSNAYTPFPPTLETDNTANVFFSGHSSSSDTGLFMLNWQLMKTPLSFSPWLDGEENESFSPCLFCNHNFPHATWNFKYFFLQVLHVDTSTPPHLLLLISYVTPQEALISLNLCINAAWPTCNFHCFELLQMLSIKKSAYLYIS